MVCALKQCARPLQHGIGHRALTSLVDDFGSGNTAVGGTALDSLQSGHDNTAIGSLAAHNYLLGNFNTGVGSGALGSVFVTSAATGDNNTAIGVNALASNAAGYANTASGVNALMSNSTGNQNTANGFQALQNNTIGYNNAANGLQALFKNISGNNNVANGPDALYSNTDGSSNTADGAAALFQNITGSSNTALGSYALFNTTGSSNIALGESAGINLGAGSNNIDIANKGFAGDSNTIRIGKANIHTKNTYILGISGAVVPGGVGVIVGTNGHLGTVVSSKRFKDEIKPMDKASEPILALKPVTFRYKKELDPDGIPQFGLVAEQVEKVDPDLVARDDRGKPYTVRYEAVNAMLLNEFLKEHRKVGELEVTVAKLQEAFKEQAAQIRKVSDKVELSKPAPQMVANDQ